MATHNSTNSRGQRQVMAVANSCDIIDIIYECDGLGVTEVADRLNLNKGTVHTQLSTLREQDYVYKEDSIYYPSMRFLEVGEGTKDQMDIYQSSRDELIELAKRTGEYAHLMIEQNGWGYIIHKEKGDRAATTTSRAGKKLHLHYTATGKAILAHLSEDRVKQIVESRGLPRLTNRTITDYESLQAELGDIRESGVSYDRGEQINGARCVGAPILQPDGTVLGAISVSGPMSRMDDELEDEKFPEMVASAANVIEMNIEVNRLNQ